MWLVPWQRMNGEGVHFNKIYGFLGVFPFDTLDFRGLSFFSSLRLWAHLMGSFQFTSELKIIPLVFDEIFVWWVGFFCAMSTSSFTCLIRFWILLMTIFARQTRWFHSLRTSFFGLKRHFLGFPLNEHSFACRMQFLTRKMGFSTTDYGFRSPHMSFTLKFWLARTFLPSRTPWAQPPWFLMFFLPEICDFSPITYEFPKTIVHFLCWWWVSCILLTFSRYLPVLPSIMICRIRHFRLISCLHRPSSFGGRIFPRLI